MKELFHIDWLWASCDPLILISTEENLQSKFTDCLMNQNYKLFLWCFCFPSRRGGVDSVGSVILVTFSLYTRQIAGWRIFVLIINTQIGSNRCPVIIKGCHKRASAGCRNMIPNTSRQRKVRTVWDSHSSSNLAGWASSNSNCNGSIDFNWLGMLTNGIV